jgi:ABC-type multidrug transport system ATPase subunit
LRGAEIMKYAIEIKSLTKSYGDFKAVNNLDICVPEGKIYGFLGKNGAGKTTTIKLIMGLIKADSGSIHVFGKNVVKDRLWASRNIGSIVETPGFYENLSARGNLDITAEMFGICRKRIDEVLEIVSLIDTKGKKVKDFSLGMKQRLGIANALIHSPQILILDEPTNGLDPSGIKDMRNFLRNLSDSKHITIMISSHILGEVQQLADYVGIIDKGSLVEEAEIQAIRDLEQSFLQIEVDKMQTSIEILNRMEMKYEIEAGLLKVFCKKSMNSIINKNLVQKEVNVSNLSSVSQSLEERFLSVTEDKSA